MRDVSVHQEVQIGPDHSWRRGAVQCSAASFQHHHVPVPSHPNQRGRADRRRRFSFRLVSFHAVPFLVVGAGSSPRALDERCFRSHCMAWWFAAATMNPVALPRPCTFHRLWQVGHSNRTSLPWTRSFHAAALDCMEVFGVVFGIGYSFPIMFSRPHFGHFAYRCATPSTRFAPRNPLATIPQTHLTRRFTELFVFML